MAKDVALKYKTAAEEAHLQLFIEKAKLDKAKSKAKVDLAHAMTVY